MLEVNFMRRYLKLFLPYEGLENVSALSGARNTPIRAGFGSSDRPINVIGFHTCHIAQWFIVYEPKRLVLISIVPWREPSFRADVLGCELTIAAAIQLNNALLVFSHPLGTKSSLSTAELLLFANTRSASM